MPELDTPAPPTTWAENPVAPPPLIVPLLVNVGIVPELAAPATPITVRANENVPPALIVPPAALVSVVIIPVFELTTSALPVPPLIAPLLVRAPIFAAAPFNTPAPVLPLIAPLLLNVATPLCFDTPTGAGYRAAVGQRGDRACVRDPGAANGRVGEGSACRAAADRPAVGQRRDRPGVGNGVAASGRPGLRAGKTKPLPPLMAPPLVSVVITPVLDTSTPPVASPEKEEPRPPVIVAPMALMRLPMFAPVPSLDSPAPPVALPALAFAPPPLIVPLLVSFVIVPELAAPTVRLHGPMRCRR